MTHLSNQRELLECGMHVLLRLDSSAEQGEVCVHVLLLQQLIMADAGRWPYEAGVS